MVAHHKLSNREATILRTFFPTKLLRRLRLPCTVRSRRASEWAASDGRKTVELRGVTWSCFDAPATSRAAVLRTDCV